MSGKDGFFKSVFSPTGKKWSTRHNEYAKNLKMKISTILSQFMKNSKAHQKKNENTDERLRISSN